MVLREPSPEQMALLGSYLDAIRALQGCRVARTTAQLSESVASARVEALWTVEASNGRMLGMLPSGDRLARIEVEANEVVGRVAAIVDALPVTIASAEDMLAEMRAKRAHHDHTPQRPARRIVMA